jgi:predicted RNA-binding Zn-ribbon protein involved in translation (DUF1610 family)
MPARITLRVTQGKLQGQVFLFTERTTCIVGRAEDCEPMLPSDENHCTISRHHCLLDINPPDIRVRDFGSLNGTYVNGSKIGQRERGMAPDEGAKMTFAEHDLKDGDEVKLGGTVFQVSVFEPALCVECSAEIPEYKKLHAMCGPGIYRCDACRANAAATEAYQPPVAAPKRCSKCGREVAAEMGQQRQGEFLCARCKAEPFAVLKFMLERANAGDTNLIAIKGYEFQKELGRGGCGAVCLARHAKTGAELALKVMLPEVALTRHAREDFLREVENSKALRHPNVVCLHHSGCFNGTFFFTLDSATAVASTR